LVALMLLPGASIVPPARAEDGIAEVKSARPVPRDRLEAIYADRTWHWPDGAAHFAAAPDRRFTAWVASGANASYAEGSWSATDDGRLCFRATWHTVRGSSAARTCFDHRTENDVIYQRKLPTGSWYVFSHAPGQPEDEMHKLEPGDQVSADYQKNRQYVADHGRRRAKR